MKCVKRRNYNLIFQLIRLFVCLVCLRRFFYLFFTENSIMVKITKVEGFEAFESKVTELAGSGGDVFVMFSGSKNADGIR